MQNNVLVKNLLGNSSTVGNSSTEEVEVVIVGRNMLSHGYKISQSYPNSRIGMVVAGNAGRAGGSMMEHYNDGTYNVVIDKVIPGHTTQEEAIFANAIHTDPTSFGVDNIGSGNKDQVANKIQLHVEWGLKYPIPKNQQAGFHHTKQKVHYVTSTTTPDIYEKAVLWGNVKVTSQPFVDKLANWEDATGNNPSYEVMLALTAGPNANCRRTPTGSTARTFDKNARDYTYFRQGVKNALKASITLLIDNGCHYVIVPGMSTGIYATNDNRPKIIKEYPLLVIEVVDEIRSSVGTKQLKQVIYTFKP